MKLTARLAAAAAFVPRGSVIVDVGTDHGYIPIDLCQRGVCPRAVASDIVRGPLSAAAAHVRQASLTERIDCRLADGLKGVRLGEVDGALICGMGGSLMIRILTESTAVRDRLSFLVLQPMSDAAALRSYLYRIGWYPDRETLIADGGRIYQLLRARQGRRKTPPQWQLEIGAENWRERTPLLGALLDEIIDKKKKILQGMRKSRAIHTEELLLLRREIAEWEERRWQCK